MDRPPTVAPGAPPAPAVPFTVEDVLAAAPIARSWLGPALSVADIALALDLGARFLLATRASPPASGPPVPEVPRPGPAAASAKGEQGEDLVYDILSRARRVRSVARRPHSGDLVCQTDAGPVCIEVKHYTGTVPASELEKFRRDLLARDAAAGVFISLTSPIAGARESVAVTLEPRVSGGTLVPVVLAAPERSVSAGRLLPEVILAAVDMAIALAGAYPRGLGGLHPRDSLLAFSVAAEQIGEGVGSVRADLARLVGTLGDGVGALGERLAAIGLESRALARAQRAEIEEARDTEPGRGELFAAELEERYGATRAGRGLLARVIDALGDWGSRSVVADILGEGKNWRLLKAQAVHTFSACSLSFLKHCTIVYVPVGRVEVSLMAGMLKTLGAKIRVANGALGVELSEETADAIVALIAQMRVDFL